jgi:hypothetical protein
MRSPYTNKNSQLIKFCLLLVALVYTNFVHSEIRQQKTSRLISTAGTGVGSILLEDAAVLNPASLAFFNNSAIYYQQTKLDNANSSDRVADAYSVIVADAKNAMKGTMGYHKNTIGTDEEERVSLTAASAGGEASSVGINISQYKLTVDNGIVREEKKYRTMDIGVTHIVSPEMSIGIIIQDPAKSDNSKIDLGIFGFQYQLHNYIAVMGDIGTAYRGTNINEKYLYRGALQLTFLSDFFIRGGISRDLTNGEERITGLGISWVQPRLTFDFAFEDIESSPEGSTETTQFRQGALSMSYRF